MKKVEIDKIIGNKIESKVKKKRGRPKKVVEPELPEIESSPVEIEPILDSAPKNETVQPIYDTRPESDLLIQVPFEIFSAVTRISELKLNKEELDAVSPSFNAYYNRVIKPKLGEDADLMAFAGVMVGISLKKITIYNQIKNKRNSQEQTPYEKFDQSARSTGFADAIKTEVVV